MQTIQITKENALKAYNDGCSDVKGVLINLLGKETFIQPTIMDRVKDFSDILSIAGVEPKLMELRFGETDDELAYRQAKLIALVYNEGTELDPGNTNQYKYYPWHKIIKDTTHPSGFGLSYDVDGSLVFVFVCRRSPLLQK